MAAGVWNEYLSDLEKKCGTLKRRMDKDRTVVEQNVTNTCFYRLLSGKIRFEKRAINSGSFSNFAILGTMDASSEWPFFCELSAFGIQKKTSAAVVVDSDQAEILVIPVEFFLELCKEKPQYKALMYENLTKRLASLLRSLHSRTMMLSTAGIAKSSQVIHNEAVILSWPAVMKGAVKMQKSEGKLVLSKNYVSFVKKKETEKKGVVSDVSNSAPTVIDLRKSGEAIHTNGKITIRDGKHKLSVTLRGGNGDVVIHVINTAKKTASLSKSENPFLQCGDEGTHVLSPSDLTMMKEKFNTVNLAPGELVQEQGSRIERIGYVLSGTVAVKVMKEGGGELVLNDVVSGETVGDIGAFMNVPASAGLAAGEKGCSLLEIPVDFVVGARDDEFRTRVYFALIQLMWNRIIRQEREQTKIWMGKMKSNESRFFEETLLREGTGKNIEELGTAGWY